MTAKEREITLAGLAEFLAARMAGDRVLVGMAGPPGAGKSTCAKQLNDLLNAAGDCRAAIFQMDGYHYDDAVLVARGLRPRKGAPETFDAAGLRHMLERLRRNEEAEIAVPVFDRELEIARAGARLIPRDVNVLIVEGNYVLLDQPPWSAFAPLFDVTVKIVTSEENMRQRLIERWQSHEVAPEDILAKVDANDLLNGKLVLAKSVQADFVLRT